MTTLVSVMLGWWAPVEWALTAAAAAAVPSPNPHRHSPVLATTSRRARLGARPLLRALLLRRIPSSVAVLPPPLSRGDNAGAGAASAAAAVVADATGDGC